MDYMLGLDITRLIPHISTTNKEHYEANSIASYRSFNNLIFYRKPVMTISTQYGRYLPERLLVCFSKYVEISLWELNNKISSPKEACDALCLFLSNSSVMMIPTTISNNRNKCNVLMKLGHGGKVYKHVEFNITSPSPQAKNLCYKLSFKALNKRIVLANVCGGSISINHSKPSNDLRNILNNSTITFTWMIPKSKSVWPRRLAPSSFCGCFDDNHTHLGWTKHGVKVLPKSIGAVKPYLRQFIDV
uniref:Uncharacterized protein n=1 Tax=Cucumis melo TaxID=3656 RepID=A0A9I9ELX9_CUCME